MFTKMHYEKVAEILYQCMSRMDANEEVAYSFADAFAKDNPLFDRDRFMRACGLTVDYGKEVK